MASNDPIEEQLSPALRAWVDAKVKVAFAEGYASAKAENVRIELTGHVMGMSRARATVTVQATPLPLAAQTAEVRQPAKMESGLVPDDHATHVGDTLPRGMPEMFVEEAYFGIWPQSATGVDILKVIKDKRGIDVPPTTLYRAMKRLAKRGAIQQIGSTAAWQMTKQHHAFIRSTFY